jgi:CRISPR/Cas system CMR-associated protein Cmr1 (group 7 of RAMP superfamily)
MKDLKFELMYKILNIKETRPDLTVQTFKDNGIKISYDINNYISLYFYSDKINIYRNNVENLSSTVFYLKSNDFIYDVEIETFKDIDIFLTKIFKGFEFLLSVFPVLTSKDNVEIEKINLERIIKLVEILNKSSTTQQQLIFQEYPYLQDNLTILKDMLNDDVF